MRTICIRKKVDSETLVLPELKPLVGKVVEIVVVELAPATREEFYAEAGHVPATAEERAAQREKFRAWRNDPRFERFWPLLERWLAEPAPPGQDKLPEKAAS
jgi:hypothetical protein